VASLEEKVEIKIDIERKREEEIKRERREGGRGYVWRGR